MRKPQQFVEGVADQKFLQDLIAEWYGIKLTRGGFKDDNTRIESGDILDMGGKTCFENPEKMYMLEPIFELLRVNKQIQPALVIFDADDYHTEKTKMDEYSEQYGFDYFLLPYNGTHPDKHQNNGDLETLLQEIICPENQVIFDRWNLYEQCLSGKTTTKTNTGKFTLPARKTKIHNYVEVLVGDSNSQKALAKEEKRNYRNKDHWNLNPEHLPLQPLKIFLDPFFSTPQ